MPNIYRLSRKRKGISIEAAINVIPCSEKTLRRIECGDVVPDAPIVNAMAIAYSDPFLPLRHCLLHYKIGIFLGMDMPANDGYHLPTEALRLLESINQIEADRPRMVEIVLDNRIDDGEMNDYQHIAGHLSTLTNSAVRLLCSYSGQQKTAFALEHALAVGEK